MRTDLERAVIDGFALPLGIAPGEIKVPTQGYTVEYGSGTDDEPDTYSFYVAVSHERVAPILHRAMELLPDRVYGIVEISSRDAYRPIDVFIGREEIPRPRFLHAWRRCEAALLEDASIAAGANSDSPFVEVFLDQWKGLSIIVPLAMHEAVEAILDEFSLEEVSETWAIGADNPALAESQIRPVLAGLSAGAPDIDDVLMFLRRDWQLDLNVDPDRNLDDGGRNLGLTLWHATVGVVEDTAGSGAAADLSIWATAGSLNELETLIEEALSDDRRWLGAEIQSTDRVAFDERPEKLAGLAPRRDEAGIHLISIAPHDRKP